MDQNNAADLLHEIEIYLAEDDEYPLEGTLLYAEIGDNFVGPSIFKDAGSHVAYRDGMDGPLCDLLMKFWRVQGVPKDMWITMEYVVRNGHFDLTVNYSDDLELDADWGDLRKEAIRRHFGDRPVLYPPPPDLDEPAVFDI